MKNLLGAGRGRVDRPEKKGAITITCRCERRCADLITALMLLLLEEKKKKKRKRKRRRKIRKFYSRVVDRAGLARVGTAGLVTIGTMVL